jgi:hypothetical protein
MAVWPPPRLAACKSVARRLDPGWLLDFLTAPT